MGKTDLTVFKRLPIPVDLAATMKYAVLAKSNGGKTYLTLKMEEQLCDLGAFFVTLDPVGKHWALRAGKDGSPEGGKSDVWVLGGLHGDVPLEPKSGSLIADTVLDHPGRYVLDVSTFDSDSEQDEFARDFARRLFRRKAKSPGFPLLLILEEAESFIPQMPRPNQTQMLGAFGRIARQGRNHGLGLWMVSQRAAALNKGVLSQADVLIAKEMSHKRDRDAVDEWVRANGTPEEREVLMASLASLRVEEAWVWSPTWLRCFERTTVLPRVTFDSSRSVRHGEAQQAVELRPLDVEALGKAIAGTAERAKADDPKVLRQQIRELERQLSTAEVEGGHADLAEVAFELELPDNAPGEAILEGVRAAKDASHQQGYALGWENGRRELSTELTAVRNVLDGVDEAPIREVVELVEDATVKLERVIGTTSEEGAAPPPPSVVRDEEKDRGHDRRVELIKARERRRQATATAPAPSGEPSENGELTLGKAHRAVLTILAQHPEGRTKGQLALQTGYSMGSGHFDNTLGKLRGAGYITRSTPILATQEGLTALGSWDPLPTGPDLLRYWCDQSGKAGELVLRELVRSGSLPKAELAERTGYSGGSGHFDNTLGKLRKLGLIAKGQPVRLTDEFADSIR